MPDPADDLTGRTLADYRVLRKLGQGGMGQVYLARQLSVNRDVALKILRAELATDPVALRRFRAEAEAAARLAHPHIVQVFAAGEADGLQYIALEYVDGRTLRDHLTLKGPPDLVTALGILRQTAEALRRAAEIGLVHRDIKPENVLLTRAGMVKVADFGLSRFLAADAVPLNLTQSGTTLGTPLYMSPEQVQGKSVDHRTDLYSFGVTAYHLLAGSPPFAGATAFEVSVQHVQTPPPDLRAARPDLPPALCGLVGRLLAKKPLDRYQSAAEVLADLDRVEQGLPLAAPARPPVPARRSRRRPVATLGLLAVAGTVGWLAAGPRAGGPAEESGALTNVRLPDPVVSARERELRQKLKDRVVRPADHAGHALDLGLLLIGERRLDDADGVFAALEQERPTAATRLPPHLVAKFGRAVVLAHRDRAAESVALFQATLAGPPRPTQRALDEVLTGRPDFAEAVAAALDRDADNLGAAKLPDRLDWLRTPGGVARGPR